MMTATKEPTFLFPVSRQYPFDEVAEQIVRALEERSWNVSGITVEFHVYGSGEAVYRKVDTITGDDFVLKFGRPQGLLGDGRYNDTAAVDTITIPRQQVTVYDDESGPTYYVYVGDDWSTDRVNFRWHPQAHLTYTAVCGDCRDSQYPRHTHTGRRSSRLQLATIQERSYEPAKTRESYRTADVFTVFTAFLEGVLAYVTTYAPTLADDYQSLKYFFRQPVTPWTAQLAASIGPIYCLGEAKDAWRVYRGHNDVEELVPSERYGFQGNGWRLVGYGDGDKQGVPKIAYDGFIWCGLGDVTPDTAESSLVRDWTRDSSGAEYVFRIKLGSADGVYIADHAPYEQRRQEICDAIKAEGSTRDRLTDAEVSEFISARGRTIIPVGDYAAMITVDPSAAYKQPILLINRELGFDEVELVSGPWPGYNTVRLIARFNDDSRDLLEAVLAARAAQTSYIDPAEKAAVAEAFGHLHDYCLNNRTLFGAIEASQASGGRRSSHARDLELLMDTAAEMRRLGLV